MYMIIAKIAAYILSIVVILGLSVKFLWLFFILFLYRTIASLIPFEWVSEHIGLQTHSVYFVIILLLSILLYRLMIRLTNDLVWVRYVILSVLILWVFNNFSFSDIFLLKDYFESNDMWKVTWFVDQFHQLSQTGVEGYVNLFSSVFAEVFGVFESILNAFFNIFK